MVQNRASRQDGNAVERDVLVRSRARQVRPFTAQPFAWCGLSDSATTGMSLICNLRFRLHILKPRPKLNYQPSMARPLKYTGWRRESARNAWQSRYTRCHAAGVGRYVQAFTSSLCGARTSRDSASLIVRAAPTQPPRVCCLLTRAACLALGLGPWLATEVPELVATGTIVASASGASGGAAAKP